MAKPAKLAKLAEPANYKVATLVIEGATSCGDSFFFTILQYKRNLSLNFALGFRVFEDFWDYLDTSIADLADLAKWTNIAGCSHLRYLSLYSR